MQLRLPQDLALSPHESEPILERPKRLLRPACLNMRISQHAEQERSHQERLCILLHPLADRPAAKIAVAFNCLDPAVQGHGHPEPLGIALFASERNQTLQRHLREIRLAPLVAEFDCLEQYEADGW
jgi:hypothetical protein